MNNGKIRIYELSRELDLENKDILAACKTLGIEVKSHSSTISDDEANKIRAQAPALAADRPSNKSPDKPSSKPSLKANIKPKAKPTVNQPQILGIRRPNPAESQSDNASPPEQAKRPSEPESPKASDDNKNGGPTANAPERPASVPKSPLRPAVASKPVSPKTPKPAVAKLTKPAIVKPNATPPAAVKPAGPPSQPASRPAASKPTPEAKPKPKPSPRPVAPPPLSGPPSRGADPKPEVRRVIGSSTPRPRPVSARSADTPRSTDAPPSSERSRPSRPGGAPKPVKKDMGDRNQRSAPPQIVELQRPKLVRPPSRPAAPSEDTDIDEGVGAAEETPVLGAGPVRPTAERPRRPAAPARPSRRGAPKRNEEYEDGENRKKAANRPKRRVHIIGDDDDDLMDQSLSGNGEMSAAISLSLARPAKPKSMQSSTPVSRPTSSPSRRRSSGGRGGGAKQRREHQKAKAEKPQRPEMITIKGGMTVQDLSALLFTPETDIIRTLFFKGIAATITQTLEVPTIELVCEELGVVVDMAEKASAARKTTEVLSEADLDNLVTRPPVVTIMGHVDHGKTTLLDSIRKTKVVDGEAGGITQHIGAYHVDVEHNGAEQQIVFLDTPGHEAFTAMRARGTRVTDIAILVVAADDGVRPQTLEAISHAKAAEVPLIVAVNKIDKEGAQPDRVKQELMEHGLVSEEWGGDTMMVPVSALKGENLDQLLENILLVAEIGELSANPDRPAKGTVIEANLDKARGPVATLLIQNGTMRVGDVLVAGPVFGRVRAMVDDRGDRIDIAGPSFAVEVLGLNEVPAAGDEFDVFVDEKEARSVASDRANEQRDTRLQQAMASRRVTLNSLSARAQEGDLKELNLLLKSDVQGSLEAIIKSLEELPQDEIQLRILLASPGEVTETDIDLAAASDGVILAFNTVLASGAKRAADEAGVDVREYDIIYKLLEDVQGAMEGLLEPEMVEEPLGQVEVRAVFSVGRNAVAGCYVQSGKATRNCKVRVRRGNNTVFEGDLDSLRRVREDVKEVNAGYECGIGVDKFNDWKEGDVIETFRMVSKRRTLSV